MEYWKPLTITWSHCMMKVFIAEKRSIVYTAVSGGSRSRSGGLNGSAGVGVDSDQSISKTYQSIRSNFRLILRSKNENQIIIFLRVVIQTEIALHPKLGSHDSWDPPCSGNQQYAECETSPFSPNVISAVTRCIPKGKRFQSFIHFYTSVILWGKFAALDRLLFYSP